MRLEEGVGALAVCPHELDRDGGGLRVEVAHLERISKMSDGPTGRPSSEVNMKSAGIGRDVQP